MTQLSWGPDVLDAAVRTLQLACTGGQDEEDRKSVRRFAEALDLVYPPSLRIDPAGKPMTMLQFVDYSYAMVNTMAESSPAEKYRLEQGRKLIEELGFGSPPAAPDPVKED